MQTMQQRKPKLRRPWCINPSLIILTNSHIDIVINFSIKLCIPFIWSICEEQSSLFWKVLCSLHKVILWTKSTKWLSLYKKGLYVTTRWVHIYKGCFYVFGLHMLVVFLLYVMTSYLCLLTHIKMFNWPMDHIFKKLSTLYNDLKTSLFNGSFFLFWWIIQWVC